MSGVVRETIYPVTRSVVEWLNHTLFPIEQGTFKYWRSILPLVRICDDTLKGKVPKWAALDAVNQYNALHDTSLTYEEIIGRQDYSMSDIGEWAAYCRLEDQEALLFGECDDVIETFREAEPTIPWIVMWFTIDDSVIVFRSPHVEWREQVGFHNNFEVCDGMAHGDLPSYVLPPDIEGSIRQDLGEF
jgi:hypothetical protein